MKNRLHRKDNLRCLMKAVGIVIVIALSPCIISKDYRAAVRGNVLLRIEYVKNGYIPKVYFSSTQDASDYYTTLLPDDFIESYYKIGGEIRVDNNGLEKIELETYGEVDTNISGMCSGSDNIIYLQDSLRTRKEITVLHELGHFYDRSLGRPSQSNEFRMIAGNEIEQYAHAKVLNEDDSYEMRSYKSSGNYNEYFATTFEEYIAVPEYLKKIAPETYNYFDSTFGETYGTEGEE